MDVERLLREDAARMRAELTQANLEDFQRRVYARLAELDPRWRAGEETEAGFEPA